MIYLHTGLPGAGKTLCTLVEVKVRAEKENRPVYFFNITDLKLPWIELNNGTEWNTVPDGSIIVIDEAQSSFRPRHTGSSVPPYIAAFETHRHRGLDVYLITQHPKLIDANIRRLVGTHVHFVRAFGAAAVVRHEWGEVQEDPQARGDSTSKLIPYDKSAFDFYKSAEVHTHKVRIPGRLIFLIFVPVVIAICGWIAFKSLSGLTEKKGLPDAVSPPARSTQVAQSQSNAQSSSSTSHKTTAQWLADRVPRVPALAYSAPVYDEVTKPITAPYPAACASMGDRCRCYSQQGTVLELPGDTCRSIIEKGFFVDWDADPKSKQSASQQNRGMGAVQAPMQSDVAPSMPKVSMLENGSTFNEELMSRNRGNSQPRSEVSGQAPNVPSRPANQGF